MSTVKKLKNTLKLNLYRELLFHGFGKSKRNFQTNQDSVIWDKRNEGRDFLKQYIKQKVRD